MTENDIQNAILEYLGYKNVFHYRNNTGALQTKSGGFVRFGAKGSPDIIVVEDGRYIGLEVKKPTGKLSKAQIEFRDRLEEAGGEYIVVRSLDDVMELF